MMKKALKISIALILCILMVNSSVCASTISMSLSINLKKEVLFESYIDVSAPDYNLSISKIKKAYDFSGNEYTIIECIPSGYYIYHVGSGKFIEQSPVAKSPYLNYEDSLYYGGPKEYYVKEVNAYKHVVTNTKIDAAYQDGLAAYCSSFVNRLMNAKDDKILDYFNDTSITSMNVSNEAKEALSITYTYHYVTSYTLLKYLNSNIGYKDGGYCGYIAANLLLYYWHKRYPSQYIVPSSWIHSSGTGLNGTYLTDKLINFGQQRGYGAGTWGLQIRNVLYDYCTWRNIGATMAYYFF